MHADDVANWSYENLYIKIIGLEISKKKSLNYLGNMHHEGLGS